MQEINQHGVARVCHMLAVVQPALSALVPTGGYRPEAAKHFERAHTYYNLLICLPDALIRIAAEQPSKYRPAEWAALLQVSWHSESQSHHVMGHFSMC